MGASLMVALLPVAACGAAVGHLQTLDNLTAKVGSTASSGCLTCCAEPLPDGTCCCTHPGCPPLPPTCPPQLDFSRPGQTFEGLGALSGGGGTSRLLYDYMEPQRSDILDALFGKAAGGALQIFKVEIGGDAQSTEATEPSHMHSRDDEDYTRGYEWWLMKEAKKRNPAIKLYALSWGAPGWVGNGSYFSDDNIVYHLKWLKGAKQVHGLDIEFIGIWNEHAASSDWIVQLRHAMDAAGFERTAIVATDQGGWPICDVMALNQTVRDAVAVIGSHYPEQGTFQNQGRPFPQAGPTPASCQILNEKFNKSLWTSEGWNLAYVNDWDGGLNLASTINRNYVLQNQTAMVVWNLIYSWYSILPFAHPDQRDPVAGMGHGLMTAGEPWSGHYKLQPPLFAMMHTTQFTEPQACRYLDNAATTVNGWLDPTNSSTIVAFDCSTWITIVAETSGLNHTIDMIVLVQHLPANLVAAAASGFDVWRTCEGGMFQKLPSTIVIDAHNRIKVTLLPRCIYTLVSSSANRGSVIPSKVIPGSASFPNIWADDFDSYGDQQTVKYFTDESGSFNAANVPQDLEDVRSTAARGMVLQQAVTQKPIQGAWWGNSEPFTMLGNSQNWTDITVEVDAMIVPIAKAAPHPAVPADGFYPFSGALLAGNDLGNLSVTWSDAVAHCNSTPTCLGFTFEGHDPQPTKPITCYFKHSTASDTDADWYSWLKQPHGGGGSPVLPSPSFVRLCGRISTFKPSGEPPQGFCLVVDVQGKWYLTTSLAHAHLPNLSVLASGSLIGGPFAKRWHRLKLSMVGSTVSAFVDDRHVGSVQNMTYTHGMVALGSGWHEAFFDNFSVTAATATTTQ